MGVHGRQDDLLLAMYGPISSQPLSSERVEHSQLLTRYSNLGTSMLDLVESVFLRNGIQNLRYDGSMNREAREYTLSRFRQNGGPKVILIRFVWLFCFVRSARFAALICDICI